MAVLPAAAAAAYQAISNIGGAGAAGGATTPGALGAGAGDFSNFLQTALKDGIGTMKQGRNHGGAPGRGPGQHRRRRERGESGGDHPSIPWWRVRDKVVQAYQSIMNMPI